MPAKSTKKKPKGGRPRKPDRGRMTMYFPVDMVERIKRVGTERRMAYSALVEEYVADGLARDEKRLAERTSSG